MSTPRDSTWKPWVVDHSNEKSFQDPFFPVPFLATGDRRLPTFEPPTRFQPWSMLHVFTRFLRNDSYRKCYILPYLRIGSILSISWVLSTLNIRFYLDTFFTLRLCLRLIRVLRNSIHRNNQISCIRILENINI